MHPQSRALEVEIDRSVTPLAGQATYRARDYSLIYKPVPSVVEANAVRAANGAWRQSGGRLFLISGFLTLTFDGVPCTLTELDGYTNASRWKEREVRVPEPTDSGALVLLGDKPAEDHVMFGGAPSIEIDRSRLTMRIVFMEGEGRQFSIGADLYACIRETRLASITLSRVLFT
jgi:hypothetical protein